MELEQRIEDLAKRIVVVKNNCHVPSGPKGGQFCSTGGRGKGGASRNRKLIEQAPYVRNKLDKAQLSVRSAVLALSRKDPTKHVAAGHLKNARDMVVGAHTIATNRYPEVLPHLNKMIVSLDGAHKLARAGNHQGALKAVQDLDVRGV